MIGVVLDKNVGTEIVILEDSTSIKEITISGNGILKNKLIGGNFKLFWSTEPNSVDNPRAYWSHIMYNEEVSFTEKIYVCHNTRYKKQRVLIMNPSPSLGGNDDDVGGMKYMGVWDATTSAPANDEKGWYYKVSVAGTTDLDGNDEWKVGDWCVWNGTTWDKIDNTQKPVGGDELVGPFTTITQTEADADIADVVDSI